jgi:GNAT superfamily N-acetyltransferase
MTCPQPPRPAPSPPSPSGASIAIVLRPVDDGDVPLVYATWLNNYRHGSKQASRMEHHAYFAHQRSVIDRLMLRDDTRFTCAADPDEPRRVYGWISYTTAGDVPVVHYLYVKNLYRRFGIARALARSASIVDEAVYTHLTAAGKALADRKLRASSYVAAEKFLQESA